MGQSTVEFSKTNVVEIIKAPPVRVLHVDDDASFLKTARPILEMQGAFQVDTAQSVKEAVEKMKKEEYDVVVSDYLMPGKNGLQFLKELRKKGNKIPFVVFTGKGREEVAVKALNLGADGYFNKFGCPETVYVELAHGIRQVVEKRRTEQSLLKSEDKYRRLVENLHEGIWAIDKDSYTTFVNPRMAEILGYSREEMIGKHLFSFTDERGIELAKRLLERRQQGIKEQHDFEFIRKDGKRIYATLETSPITDDDGNYIGSIAGVMDTTERKKAEEELRENEERFRNIVENSQDVIMLTQPDGIISYLSPACSQVLGYEPAELVGKQPWIFHPDDLEKVKAVHYDALKGGKGSSLEYRVITKTGETRWIFHSWSPIIADNKVKLIVSVVRDITEAKQAEETLRRSSEQARNLLEFQNKVIDTAIVWIDLLDREGNVTLWNRAAELISGYTREEVIGHRKIWEWCYPDPQYRTEVFARAKRIIDEELELNFETEVTCKDGVSKTISWYTNSITDGKGNPVGSIAVGLDVSQLKKAERELHGAMEKLQVLNEKLRVVGGLTRHDVRNKLTAVTGNAYLARKKLPGNSEVLDYLRQIEASVEEAVRILDFARTYEMLGVEELTYVTVEKAVDEAIALFADFNGMKVTNNCHGLTVLADSLLRQLFYNLIDNSLKYGKKTTRIRLNYGKAGHGKLKLIYEDDGVGISVADKSKLFKEGYSTGGSTGYGLHLIRKIVEVYGWTIEETGESGKGAQFTITIPKTNQNGKENYQIA